MSRPQLSAADVIAEARLLIEEREILHAEAIDCIARRQLTAEHMLLLASKWQTQVERAKAFLESRR